MTVPSGSHAEGCGIAVWKDGGYYCPHVGCTETLRAENKRLRAALESISHGSQARIRAGQTRDRKPLKDRSRADG